MTTLEQLNLNTTWDGNGQEQLVFQGHTFGCSCCEHRVEIQPEDAAAEFRKIAGMYRRMTELYVMRSTLLEKFGLERIRESKERLENLNKAKRDLAYREDSDNLEQLKKAVLGALYQMCQPMDRDINNAFLFIDDGEL